jgi:DNA ligase (NAD+)
MEIEGIGLSWVEKLVEAKLVATPIDLITLTAENLAKLDNMGETRIEGFLSTIGKAKRVPLEKFLQSLGIHTLGRSASGILASTFKDLQSIRALQYQDLEKLEGFGEVIAKSIVDGLQANASLIDGLLAHVSIDNGSAKVGGLSGLSFLFTGTLSMKRNEAEAKVIENGGSVASSVSKNLSYLVAGEKAGSKLDKANSLGVKVITESEFLAML